MRAAIRATIGAAIAVTALAGTAGCSTSEPTPEPESLTGPTNFHEICVSTRHASQWTVAVATAVNEGAEAVTLDEASLSAGDGIELIGTDVIRPGELVATFGVWNGFPPRGMDPLDRRLWRSRDPVEGHLVEPGERVNFLLHLRGEPGASAGPLEVSYRSASGSEQTYETNVRYLIDRDCVR